jgi:hypothetical protein
VISQFANENPAAGFKRVLADEILSLPVSDLEETLAVNTVSSFSAAQEAVKGFATLDASVPKGFIFTGNILNLKTMPALFTLGVGKAASAHWVSAASMSYPGKSYGYVALIRSSITNVRLTLLQ